MIVYTDEMFRRDLEAQRIAEATDPKNLKTVEKIDPDTGEKVLVDNRLIEMGYYV